mmetsp:Transcript_42290/g.71513  ORF Transcript_42290/g.71513 Transcript_42290/m.71513 type:complete len:639 (-) Transcript_42290:20-1936(-)
MIMVTLVVAQLWVEFDDDPDHAPTLEHLSDDFLNWAYHQSELKWRDFTELSTYDGSSCISEINGTNVVLTHDLTFCKSSPTITIADGTDVTVYSTIDFEGNSNVTYDGMSITNSSNDSVQFYLIMYGNSSIMFMNNSAFYVAQPLDISGSGTIDFMESSNFTVANTVNVGVATTMASVMHVASGGNATFDSDLTVTGTGVATVDGQVNLAQTFSSDYRTQIQDSAIVNGSGLVYVQSGNTYLWGASMQVLTEIGGTATTTLTRSIATNGTADPLLTLCGTTEFGSTATNVGSGAGLNVYTNCTTGISHTSGYTPSAYTSTSVSMGSGSYMIMNYVTQNSYPLVIDSTLTFNDSSKFVVLVSDNATSSWTANLVVYQASSSTCTTPTDYALDNCGSLGCGLESSMIDSTYCLLRLSNGNNYDSSTFNFQCLLPCTVLTASYFANLVSIYVPNAVGKLKNIVAGCNGDSTLSSARRSLETAGEQEEVAVSKFQIQATASGTYVEWLCTSYSTSAATTICNEVANNEQLRAALGVTTSDQQGSNEGLWALFAFMTIPVLLCCGLLGAKMAQKKKATDQQLALGRDVETAQLLPEDEKAYPVHEDFQYPEANPFDTYPHTPSPSPYGAPHGAYQPVHADAIW